MGFQNPIPLASLTIFVIREQGIFVDGPTTLVNFFNEVGPKGVF